MSDEMILAEIADLMQNHKGKRNAISAGEIGKMLNLKQEDTHVEARERIKETIQKFKIPIIAGGKGYYIATSEDELDNYIEGLDNRIRAIESRKELVRKAFKEYYNE